MLKALELELEFCLFLHKTKLKQPEDPIFGTYDFIFQIIKMCIVHDEWWLLSPKLSPH